MTEGIRPAVPMRASLLLALLLPVLTMMTYRPQASAQSTEGAMSIDPFFSSALVGEEFSISVFLTGLRREGIVYYDSDGDTAPDREMQWPGLGAFEFTIRYDPARFQVTAAEPDPSLEASGRTFGCLERTDEPGSFTFGCFSLGRGVRGPAGDLLVLAKVTFLSLRPGSSPLLLLQARVSDPLASGQVPLPAEGGIVHVLGGPPATATFPPPAVTASPPLGPGEDAATAAPTTAATAATTPGPGEDTAATEPFAGTATATVGPASEEGPTLADPGVPGPGAGVGNQRSPNPEGDSTGRRALWLAAATVGGLAALGGLGLTAARWQRRRRRRQG